jgi:hypothetical protein
MPDSLPAEEVLNREFLQIRAKILEIGATLDRLDRGDGSVDSDPRMAQIRRGLETLLQSSTRRAEQIQMVFSLPYDERWRDEFARHGGRDNGAKG